MIQVYKFDSEAKLPTKAHLDDAAWDLYCLQDTFVPHRGIEKIRTGIAINVPIGYMGKIHDRSSLAVQGFETLGGVIDAGYAGEILVIMQNNLYDDGRNLNVVGTTCGKWFLKGEKIAQISIEQIDTSALREVHFLWNSNRGTNGFGSSGS